MENQAIKIIKYLRENISHYPADIVDRTSNHFKVTRTTVHRHLRKLINKGEVIKTGKTRDVMYYLSTSMNIAEKFQIRAGLEEFKVYNDYLKEIFSNFAENIESICFYGFTEIFNNALDHSRGTMVWIDVACVDSQIKITITDNGVGVFKTIYDFFQLEDLYESVLQLSKGKMTTSPDYHSGEGLFFASRVFDVLEIFANNIHYVRDNCESDWALEFYDTSKFGSKVTMLIKTNSQRNLVDTFKAYQDPKNLEFNRTDIFVKLSQFGQEQLISRSQAKRILLGLEKRFKLVTLDFIDIKLVGQGFVDEVFRVYKNQHPEVKIEYINATSDVEFMIKRGIATAS